MASSSSSFLLLGFSCLSWLSSATDCRVSIVGGGWAGVYAAWRIAVDSKVVEPQNVCLIEARQAIGGRTYSVKVGVDGEEEPLVVDVGAYRFAKEQRLPADLVKHFNLSTQCYKPSCSPEEGMTLYRIVDENGDSTGYGTVMQLMHQQLVKAGVRVFLNLELAGVLLAQGASLPLELQFVSRTTDGLGGASNKFLQAEMVLLNLPRRTMQKLQLESVIFDTPLSQQLLQNCTPPKFMALKVYAIYRDPWWMTKLGLFEGYFTDMQDQPPFVGRYHDGAVMHLPGGQLGAGALEVLYSFTHDNSFDWYKRYRPNETDPLTISDDPELLAHMHKRLMDFHAKKLAARGISSSAIAPPLKVVMGFWDATGVSRGILTNPEDANDFGEPATPCLKSITANQYVAAVSNPTQGKYKVFIANNDFYWDGYSGSGCCWAENSLKPMEALLHEKLGLGRPAWLDTEYYEKDVLLYGIHPDPMAVSRPKGPRVSRFPPPRTGLWI